LILVVAGWLMFQPRLLLFGGNFLPQRRVRDAQQIFVPISGIRSKLAAD